MPMETHTAKLSNGLQNVGTSGSGQSAGQRHDGESSARDSTLSQLMGIYFEVSAALICAWVFGLYQFSLVWIFLIISALFVVWKSVLTKIIRKRVLYEENVIHRKRALRQSETGEWINFIVNRWWVFSADSIENIVKKHINERLTALKPAFVSELQLLTFTFGDATPAIKYVQAFEISEGVPGGRRPMAWNSIFKPPSGLDHMSSYHVVIEMEMDCHYEDFVMTFRSKVGFGRAGISFDTAVEEFGISGNLQIILHMSMDVPFPHVSKATVSFIEEPKLWFNIRVLKALQIMEVPLLKSWIHTNITDGLTKALVDPGKIDIPIAKAGPVHISNTERGKEGKRKLAAGVLTLTLKGYPVADPKSNDERYTLINLGGKKRRTPNVMASDQWDDVCSFFVYDLATEKLIVKSKCRRLLSNVTLEYHEIDLSSFPLQLNSGTTTSVKNKDGSYVDVKMQYTSLPAISHDVTATVEQPDINEVAGVMYVCVHGASNLIASDKGGTSDPYCVVFCDRRRVLTTPYVLKNRSPVWETPVEFFVRDFTKATLSFYVYDWDGTNIIDDDFLGSTHFMFKEGHSILYKENLSLGYNNQLDGFQTDIEYGHITVSVTFRPVPNVTKSERFRQHSVNNANPHDYLYREDLVSPSTASSVRAPKSNSVDRDHDSQGGGPSTGNGRTKSGSAAMDDIDDKIFIDLTIIQAKELQGMDRNGLSDPYCNVLVGGNKVFKTSVKNNTLDPKWNESTTFQVKDDTHLVEINMFDKDMISKDFMGKVVLTLEQLKEISHKGTAEWIPLQRTKSGQIQIKCSVVCPETMIQSSKRPASKRSRQSSSDVFFSSPDSSSQSRPDHLSLKENENYDSSHSDTLPPDSPRSSLQPPDSFRSSEGQMEPEKVIRVNATPTERKPIDTYLQRSVSDVSDSKRNKFLPSNNSYRKSDLSPTSASYHSDNISLASSIVGVERLYNVEGRVTEVRGLSKVVGKVYLKIRLENKRRTSSSSSRFSMLSRMKILAKSGLFPADRTALNLSFQIDKGGGVNVDTNLVFDVKNEQKNHIAQKTVALKVLFEGEKESQWLTLNNGVELLISMQYGCPDPNLVNKKHQGYVKSPSFWKGKT